MAEGRRSGLAALATAATARAGFVHVADRSSLVADSVLSRMGPVCDMNKSGTSQQVRKTKKPRPRPEQIPEARLPSGAGGEGRSSQLRAPELEAPGRYTPFLEIIFRYTRFPGPEAPFRAPEAPFRGPEALFRGPEASFRHRKRAPARSESRNSFPAFRPLFRPRKRASGDPGAGQNFWLSGRWGLGH